MKLKFHYALHYILIEYHCFILTILSQKLIFVILTWEWNCAFTWPVKNRSLKIKPPNRYPPTPSSVHYRQEMNIIHLGIAFYVFSPN